MCNKLKLYKNERLITVFPLEFSPFFSSPNFAGHLTIRAKSATDAFNDVVAVSAIINQTMYFNRYLSINFVLT